MPKVGLGGSCYWCTEAIFRSLIGVEQVEQGWLSAVGQEEPSEGVIVEYDEQGIDLLNLIRIHLHTHSCTSNHVLRGRYRSAVYVYNPEQYWAARSCLESLQAEFDQPVITQVLDFKAFKSSRRQNQDYYYSNPNKPFCRNQITPKLQKLLTKFGDRVEQSQRAVIEGEVAQRGRVEMTTTKDYPLEHDTVKHEYRIVLKVSMHWSLIVSKVTFSTLITPKYRLH
ncbi:peptide-methionine (S)-S-oxide reductase [Photobacterium chitinilyticum]|uniref:peptide-methionine (S)-S-oxide reductase n=1 Tax=Photobacterium chitinilyticum TaxID=2485123 RepID=A0A444JNV7_9GAMM|nr:peptide-methionine (S)-S-oxide reductase [Photobacterium chitinilyticum]RWX54776.1 peptide methionine sulfoxide reductase [Photobacterium chitinilyticum]